MRYIVFMLMFATIRTTDGQVKDTIPCSIVFEDSINYYKIDRMAGYIVVNIVRYSSNVNKIKGYNGYYYKYLTVLNRRKKELPEHIKVRGCAMH